MTEYTHDCSRDFTREAIEAIHDPFARLRVLMKRLLDPGGCPWDREQTHGSLARYMLEEAYEVVEAIEEGDDRALCEELGDVALQVVFHSELARRAGSFDSDHVLAGVCEKLLDRHPHVFGDVVADDAGEVLENWEKIKKKEKQEKARAEGKSFASVLSGVPGALPALQQAARLQEKASRVGFDWNRVEDVCAKVCEEVGEFLEAVSSDEMVSENDLSSARDRMNEEFGDLLFSLVNLSRFLDIPAEDSLRQACRKFKRRFEQVELDVENSGKNLETMPLKEMDQLWNEVKEIEEKSDARI